MSSWSVTTNDGWAHSQPCACENCRPRTRSTFVSMGRHGNVPKWLLDGAATTIQKYVRRRIVQNTTVLPTGQRSLFDRWEDDATSLDEEQCNPCLEDEETMTVHPEGWTVKNHYSELGWQWCGQSCPCCRAKCGDILGACPLCAK